MSTPKHSLRSIPPGPWRWLLLNLLVLPGLGSIQAGRRGSGYCQLLLGVAGVLLAGGALLRVGLDWVHALELESSVPLDRQYIGWGTAGVVMFFASWFWALATSLRLLSQTQRDEPPKLTR
jgi:hypothetical protein